MTSGLRANVEFKVPDFFCNGLVKNYNFCFFGVNGEAPVFAVFFKVVELIL